MVNALVATYVENSSKQRQGLEECMVAFNKAVEGDLDTTLDKMTQARKPEYLLYIFSASITSSGSADGCFPWCSNCYVKDSNSLSPLPL